MTDDDKTPVDTKCGAPIRDRNGTDLGYTCNLTRGHLGKHAQVMPFAQSGFPDSIEDAG